MLRHTVLTCVSGSMLVYPWKKSVPENMREGVVSGTVFANHDTGWINADLWFKFFIQQILSARPHTSHTSIELIKLVQY